MDKQQFLNKVVVHIGDTWRVIGVGAQRDGNTFCHMASTHRGRQQKNGWYPVQINDWVDTAVLEAARADSPAYTEEEYQAQKEAQDDEYEERVRSSYSSRGYHNIY